MTSWRQAGAALIGSILVLAGAGCLQIDTTIRLHEDGSATIVERLNYSRKLLDIDKGGTEGGQLATLLSRQAAMERLKQLGPGVTLVDYRQQSGEQGSRECVVTYKSPDIETLTYTSPFLANRGLPGVLKFNLEPYLKHGWRTRWPAGALIINVGPDYPGDSKNNPQPPLSHNPVRPVVSPEDLQSRRELSPIVRDLLRGFSMKIRLETYAPVVSTRGLAHRGRGAAVSYVELLDISDQDLDKYGYAFFENEEIMLQILQWKLSTDYRRIDYADVIADQLEGQAQNATLPVYHGGGGGNLLTRPSRQLFDKYFRGRNLENRDGKYPATFEEIGYHPDKGIKK